MADITIDRNRLKVNHLKHKLNTCVVLTPGAFLMAKRVLSREPYVSTAAKTS